jgi:hypothetical protein
MKATPWLLLYSATSLFTSTALAQSQLAVAPAIELMTIAEIGPHHRVWQRITVETDENGNTISRTNSAYTELETGMNVQQPDGSYVEASDEIEITTTGAIAQKTRHQVTFAGNCNTAVAIDLLAADGQRFQSHVLGLSYLDTATGQSVMIAEVKDSGGRLMPSKNEVVYFDAFTGLRGNISYQNSKAGLEQNIILTGRPPAPAAFNLNKQTVVLQVLSEFVAAPEPQKQQTTDSSGRLVDVVLNFGDLSIGRGRSFLIGEQSDQSIDVKKYWGHPGGRTILIEEVDYTAIEPLLNTLTASAAPILKNSPDGVLYAVSAKRLLPPVKVAKKSNPPMKLAGASWSGKGVLIDYSTASSSTNFTFQGDTTYYVSGTVNLSGTNTVFEGGAVFKFSPTNTPKLNITSPIIWQGGMYRPVVMTARDDDTVGDKITGSTGNPNTNYFANPALYIDGATAGTNAILQNLRIAFAQSAIVFNGSTGHVVSHAQLVNCANGVTATNTDFSLRNALLYNVLTNFDGSSATGRCEHLTVDTANWMNNNSALTLTMTNSLLVSVTNTGSFTSNSVSTGTASAFQTVGAAGHYLADGTYRNGGTPNINAALLADLKQRTTYPPIVLTNNFTVDTTLSPQAGRDTDTPDLGYHYDPLDYVVGLTLTNTMQLTNGVALGTYGASITLGTGGRIISEGSPVSLNWIVRYNTVQEQATTNWSASSSARVINLSGNVSGQLQVSCNFTAWSLLGNHDYHLFGGKVNDKHDIAFKDCQFGGGSFHFVADSSGSMTNCLWDRVSFDLEEWKNDPNQYLYNNLFRGGSVIVNQGNSLGNWVIKDNLFDQTIITQGGILVHSNNAYISGFNRLTPTNANDVVLTNIPVYLTSYLGKYYYPTNDGMLSLLIDAGSQNATNAGLYHYTVLTNQVKETNSIVDIGFHYVATDTNGVPIDTDGDGVPDYLEDANGNGVVDSGETDWNSASDLGLKVIITRPRNGSTIP